MDILALYNDFNVEYRLGGQHRHCRTGWVNSSCPFCSGNPGYHLGYCYDSTSTFHGKFVCWRCGGKKLRPTLAALLKVSEDKVSDIISKYGGRAEPKTPRLRPQIDRFRSLQLPPYTLPLSHVSGAVKYLQNRNFSVDELTTIWGVQATGPGSILTLPGNKRIDLSYRLIIPIHLDGRVVSWQARDWTGKSKLRYITCPKEVETIFHKDTLYGLDEVRGLEEVVMVEGVTDAWRWGPGAVACFGIKFRTRQVARVAKFKSVTILFDPESQARSQADKVARDLRSLGCGRVVSIHLPMGKDPADMTREELKSLVMTKS